VAIYPEGDSVCLAQAKRGQARLVSFGPGGSYFFDQGDVVERDSGERFSLAGVDLHGAHSFGNAAAAIAAGRVFELAQEQVEEGLARFRPLPHRMALVGRAKGVRFYDDSKATNVGAAVTALAGLAEPSCVLIAGGRDKGGSYEPLVQALIKKGRAVVLLGEARDRIAEAIGERLHVEFAVSIPEAVERAFLLAKSGDALLLSPACSSLDMFENYQGRGESFTQAALKIIERQRQVAQ
jgi:UDP-N-acetylmuramoylalanine--D-glutamate ligase